MEFKEIETKYRADQIELEDFIKCLTDLAPELSISVSSYDHYFMKSENEFLRYRAGDKPELTVKIKSKDKNNFIRTEVNCPLDPLVSEQKRLEIATAFCETLGFKHNFTIFKECLIYFFPNCNVVYYVVYDSNHIEQNRFIEVEMKEEGWASEEEAWAELVQVEKKLTAIGITPQNRLRKSLFEIFRKV